jgi:cholesterol oxidase
MHNDPIDVIVIGSGFGGAVAANRLALAGKRVLVLERGPWRDSVPVRSMGIARRSPFPYGVKAVTQLLHSLHGSSFSVRLNKTGMFELGSFTGMYTLAASAVGGGSTAYGGLLETPRNPALWRACHPALDPADIERHYDKVIRDLGGVRISREMLLPQTVWDHFPDAGNKRCRPAAEQPHWAMLTPSVGMPAGSSVTDSNGVERQRCSFDGDGFLGSRGGAKASVDFVYLAAVLEKGGTVRDLCEVIRVRRAGPAPGSGYVVEYRDLHRGVRETAVAPQVVMAAGTLNTLRLLFSGSSSTDGLAPMPALGRGFFGNGDLVGAWIKPSVSVPSFHSAGAQGALSVAGHEEKPIGVGGLPGFDSWPLPGFVKRFLARVFFMYGMGCDSGKATVSFVKGRLRPDYDYRREPIYDELRAAFRIVSEESGIRMYPLKKPLTPHMGGGARIGANAQEGVIDHRGEVYGNPGLYVVDASALPAPTGSPPSVAIAAWAHYVADGIAQRSSTLTASPPAIRSSPILQGVCK